MVTEHWKKKKGPDFVPHKPSENVSKYLKENPSADWKQALNFVLDNYPQIVDAKLVWILEGGAAVYLLNPSRADTPDDVDIVTKSEQMAKDFTNTLTFNVVRLICGVDFADLSLVTESLTYCLLIIAR